MEYIVFVCTYKLGDNKQDERHGVSANFIET